MVSTWRRYYKGKVSSWIQRRCSKCGRFLSKVQMKYCSNHNINNPIREGHRFNRVIRHRGMPSKSDYVEVIAARRHLDLIHKHKNRQSILYRPENRPNSRYKLSLEEKYPDAEVVFLPYNP